MLGFPAKLPVTDEQRRWVDRSFERLVQIFGRERMLDAQVVLPIVEHFPDPYDNTESGVEHLFTRVCGYMQFDPNRVSLEVRTDHTAVLRESLPYWRGKSSGAAGTYAKFKDDSRYVIAIREPLLKDPLAAVAILAHELAHAILVGGELIDESAQDLEQFTDLTTVFLGLGVFTANAAVRFEQHQDYSTQGWSIRTLGYLPEEVYGYALARFAMERGELRPPWTKHLSTNVRAYFKRSIDWLSRAARSSV